MYPISKITLNTISIIFIGVSIPLPKINTLKSNIRMNNEKGTVKRTASNCSLALIIAGIIGNTSPNNKNLLFCFNTFGG